MFFSILKNAGLKKTCIPAILAGINPYDGNKSIIYLSFIDVFVSIGFELSA